MIIESVSKPKEGINLPEKLNCFVCPAEGLGCAAEFLNSEQLALGIVSCVILSVLCLVFLKISAWFCG